MDKRAKRPSAATVISMAALFVALSGSSYAAIKANTIGAKQIKSNAVRAAEIQDGAVGANEIPDGSLTGADVQNESLKSADVDGLASGDITDESLNGGDVEDGTLGSGDVTDESLTGADVEDESLQAGDLARGTIPPPPPDSPEVFARVDLNAGRTLEPNDVGFAPQNQGLAQADVVAGEGGAATGTTCFNLPSRPASAQVTLDNADAAAADRNLVASVAIDRGEDLGDCPAAFNDARVRIVDGATEAAQNARFFIWFLR
jgi:hypothetical protein